MKDAETGQRGYLLTGRVQLLEPFNGAYRQANQLLDQATQLTRDNLFSSKICRLSTGSCSNA
jgi:CHASE3 domain sensor protein